MVEDSDPNGTGVLEPSCVTKGEIPKTKQDPLCQRPCRVGSRGPIGPPCSPGAWAELYAHSVPSKDKRRHGFALQERHLTVQTWEDMCQEVASFGPKRG